MKIRCLECRKIHLTEGWVPLGQTKDGKTICEIHITCSCLNKMTVEHSHPHEVCYREAKNVTLALGCDVINGKGEEVSHYHNFDDVMDHYYRKSHYDQWTTHEDSEALY